MNVTYVLTSDLAVLVDDFMHVGLFLDEAIGYGSNRTRAASDLRRD